MKTFFSQIRIQPIRLASLGILCAVLAVASGCGGKSYEDAVDPETNSVELCDLSESGLVDFVGAASTGAAATALIAGQSIAIIATTSVTAVLAAPAIDPTLTGAVLTVSALYASLKAWCHRDSLKQIASDVKNYSGEKVKIGWDKSKSAWRVIRGTEPDIAVPDVATGEIELHDSQEQ